jgi:very-short-patch-repair endonuclease
MVTLRQLAAAGLDDSAIAYRVRTRRLIRVHRGVFAVGHLPMSPNARTMAAVLACGPHAVASHRSAAALWGILRPPFAVEVTAPTKHDQRGITVHRSRLVDADITRHYDIPTTTPARTVLDLADLLTPASLTRAANDLRLANLLSLDDLTRQLGPGRRTVTLKRLVARPTAPTRSVFEDTFLAFVDRYRLPRPEVNATVAGYEVDMLWRRHRLVAELDGREYHEEPFERDREKDADLVTAGYRVIRITWERLIGQPAREAVRFRTLLA